MRPEDVAAVVNALRAVYRPWLEDAALRFQKAVLEKGYPLKPGAAPGEPVEDGTCVLFADGLRFDVGMRLLSELEAEGLKVSVGRSWVALPSVTSTAKPAVSPLGGALDGNGCTEDFAPKVKGQDKLLTTDRFRKMLADAGTRYLPAGDAGDGQGRAWTEHGKIDKFGHEMGWELAKRVPEEVRSLAGRVRELLDAGWRGVRVVTDHGWLLLPGGLPKVDLPGCLAESRWGRCASLKANAHTDLPVVPWYWNPDVRVAMAPGIARFVAGSDYAHGGLSLQECVVPVLVVTSPAQKKVAAIVEMKWIGLRCKAVVQPAGTGLSMDLRTKPADPATTIAGGGRPVEQDGLCSLVVEDDGLAGTACAVVLIGDGTVIAKVATTVGGES